MQIVGPSSAVLDVANESQIPLDSTHITLCKFDSSRDTSYLLLEGSIFRMVRDAMEMLSAQPPFPQPNTELQEYSIDDSIKTMLDKHFPLSRNFMVEIQNLSFSRDSSTEPVKKYTLYSLFDPEANFSAVDYKRSHPIHNHGYRWVHVPANNRAWVKVRFSE